MSSSSALKWLAGLGAAAGVAYGVLRQPAEPVAAQQKSAAADNKKKMLVRRHSSGDHAFLPTQRDIEAKKIAQKSFGVQEGHVQDSEV
mmetsp:Transcript_24604/g.51511  ORF Transcript_24604/g.51511 Transcript_24604/m.51511 type:complete len:88 (-) Transcript_24604:765-1028(-)